MQATSPTASNRKRPRIISIGQAAAGGSGDASDGQEPEGQEAELDDLDLDLEDGTDDASSDDDLDTLQAGLEEAQAAVRRNLDALARKRRGGAGKKAKRKS